jgi:hypothetical protein
VVLVGKAAQLALSAESGPTTARRSVAQENRSSARKRRKTRVRRALTEIEVDAFETFEPRAPEFGCCTSIGLAKVETHSSFRSGAQSGERLAAGGGNLHIRRRLLPGDAP